ncbi:MAG: hypothetical protein A2275_02875 [Bacteroidetes bacterium RIFOXYA12_FULL_35_11]|nr:MAG: hypothetical protein A2X01_01830 [Bacteroidetes bacterium GWF2_35_48]OFY75724.1 MAG: hypothetical protein A2275_02875 [Bacteroidetes bacterium RIFOXYA12_FULL_35_11]OFY95380.1 MAG: hypothetical protein A2309_01670 [Bacteroidetes bacterium RIFOXYB2_FULL_35_7]OFY97509.1 MAG: hypothetical protein A2491_00445 [Bacteroidetes bacterium RIFOXYC12_FULL_35_7]HBX51528.1 hypothetical protein [Bacteroidales bacterium]
MSQLRNKKIIKIVAIFFFCIASFIYISHSIIPHHHHEGNACIEKDHNHHEESDDDHHHPCDNENKEQKSDDEKCTLKELVVVQEKTFNKNLFNKKTHSSYTRLFSFSDFISSQISGTCLSLVAAYSRGDPDIFISSQHIFITQSLLRAPPITFS